MAVTARRTKMDSIVTEGFRLMFVAFEWVIQKELLIENGYLETAEEYTNLVSGTRFF